MDILFLTLTCLFFAAQYIPNKIYQKNSDSTVNASMYRGFLGIVFSLAYLFIVSGPALKFGRMTALFAAGFVLCSVLGSVTIIIGLACGKLSAIVFFSLSGGMVIPAFYGFFFLGEAVTVPKIIGIILIFAAMIPNFVGGEKEGEKGEKKKRFLFLLCCMGQFFANGMVSVFTKMQSLYGDAPSNSDFLKLIKIALLFAYAVGIIICALVKKKKDETGTGIVKLSLTGVAKTLTAKNVIVAVAMCALIEITNTVGNVFSLRCAQTMDATIQFPIISAAVILTTAVYSSFIFGEKPKARDIITLALSISGIAVTMIP